jgi:hypothetical protein
MGVAALTRTIGPVNAALGPASGSVSNTTTHAPAGKVDLASQVPARSVPERRLRVSLLPPTVATTRPAANLPPPSNRVLMVNRVLVVPDRGDTLAS